MGRRLDFAAAAALAALATALPATARADELVAAAYAGGIGAYRGAMRPELRAAVDVGALDPLWLTFDARQIALRAPSLFEAEALVGWRARVHRAIDLRPVLGFASHAMAGPVDGQDRRITTTQAGLVERIHFVEWALDSALIGMFEPSRRAFGVDARAALVVGRRAPIGARLAGSFGYLDGVGYTSGLDVGLEARF